MRAVYRKFTLIHVTAFLMLLITWLAGEAIKTAGETPFVAVYYVLHIFPGSVIFILILLEWMIRNPGVTSVTQAQPWHVRLNGIMHRFYYLILLLLPLTGIVIFFEPFSLPMDNGMLHAFMSWFDHRPIYALHSTLFDLLLILILINIVTTTIGYLQQKKHG